MGTTWRANAWTPPPTDHSVAMPPASGYAHIAGRSGSGEVLCYEMMVRHPDVSAHLGRNLPTNLTNWLGATQVEIGQGIWCEGHTYHAHEIRAMIDGLRAVETPARPVWCDVSCMYYAASAILEVVMPGAVIGITMRHHLDRALTHLRRFNLLLDANGQPLPEDDRYAIWLWYCVNYGLVGDSVLVRNCPNALRIEYDRQATQEGFVGLWTEVYTALGADPALVDLEAAWDPTGEHYGIGKWDEDPDTAGYLARLEADDAELAAVLRSGAYTVGGRILAEYASAAKPAPVVAAMSQRGIG